MGNHHISFPFFSCPYHMISSFVMPPASPPTIRVTGTRVPRMTGLPCWISGSITIRYSIFAPPFLFILNQPELISHTFGAKRSAAVFRARAADVCGTDEVWRVFRECVCGVVICCFGQNILFSQMLICPVWMGDPMVSSRETRRTCGGWFRAGVSGCSLL